MTTVHIILPTSMSLMYTSSNVGTNICNRKYVILFGSQDVQSLNYLQYRLCDVGGLNDILCEVSILVQPLIIRICRVLSMYRWNQGYCYVVVWRWLYIYVWISREFSANFRSDDKHTVERGTRYNRTNGSDILLKSF